MTYKILENPKFSKGDRVSVTRDISLHFGGVLKKGEKGTFIHVALIGSKRWVKVEMDKGYNMSFSNDNDIELSHE